MLRAARDAHWFRWRRLRRWSAGAASALGALVVALWLADICGAGGAGGGSGGDAPTRMQRLAQGGARVAIVALLAAVAVWAAAALAARLAGSRRPGSRWQIVAALALPAVLAASFAVRFAGLDSEVNGRYYLDEGTYYHHATEIDDGEPLPYTFVYPHLTYYADALTLWAAARFPAAVAGAARRWLGLTDPLAVAWLLLRGVVALLSALTVLPVYGIARRLAGGGRRTGLAAALLAAALLVVSDLYNEGSHLNTCDVPAAFFATVCLYFVTRLLDRETARDYALAGAAAGLAGASKYPAALVVAAVAAVWLVWRVRRRDWNGGLLWAALACIAAVLAAMPALLAYPRLAFTGSRGIFFGARQYGGGGWLGVMPDSNAAFYAGRLVDTFGWPAVAAGASGLVLLAIRERWRGARLGRLLALAPFPILFLVLVTSMNMVVKRNLYPAVPVVAAYLGAGMAQWLGLAARRASARRRPAPGAPLPPPLGAVRAGGGAAWTLAAAVLLAATLWLPARLVALQTAGYLRPSTREEAAAWMLAHLPQGAAIVKEQYTPDFAPGRFAVTRQRFAARMSLAELRGVQNDYLLLSSAAYARFADPDQLFTDTQREIAARYAQIFRSFPLVREWDPDDVQLGPVLRLYRLDPAADQCPPSVVLPAADASVPDDAMRPVPERPLRYLAAGQWSLFHVCLPAGRYQLDLLGAPRPPARVRVTDPAGALVDRIELRPPARDAPPPTAGPSPPSPPSPPPGGPDPAAAGGVLTVARAGKLLLYVELAPGSRLRALRLTPAAPAASAAGHS